MNRTKMLAALEGLLYITGDDGLTPDEIAYVFEITPSEAVDLLESLTDMYDNNLRGITILNTANNYKIVTKKEYVEIYRKIYANINKTRLSNASLEVLAIVGYKQPITRAEIEDVRGINSDNIIRKLMAMSLVKEVGRLDTPGRPILYGTTKEYLDYFKLSSLEELPELLDHIEIDNEMEKDLFNNLTKLKIN
ncbi:SMC-Scp complex subunit ScpB [Mycoplasmatota bacterium]|nr:SMC-Scp complex subunit ScpB [Mycoplasmatota bacterium]